jgi:hypothetical protein
VYSVFAPPERGFSTVILSVVLIENPRARIIYTD